MIWGNTMGTEQVEAKHFKKGDYIMIDEVACRVQDNAKSAPGKHGHLKCVISASGIIDGKKRLVMKPGDAKLPAPNVDKREGQVVSISGDAAQVMDMKTYEMFDITIPEELKENVLAGTVVEYWLIDTIRAIMSVKE